MDRINILYISLSGNTKFFINKLTQYLNAKEIEVNAINVKENREFNKLDQPFVTFLPTFLKGGNGVNNGDIEILTTPLKKHLEYMDNYRYCYGIIGSGNRNFNKQFALTAKQYSENFKFPYITDFELRGTNSDLPRITDAILRYRDQFDLKTAKE